MIDEKYKIFYNYSYYCHRGNEEKFKEMLEKGAPTIFFNGDFSRKKVIDYFFGGHNDFCFSANNLDHAVLPYQVKLIRMLPKIVTSDLLKGHEVPETFKHKNFTYDRIQEAKKRGVLEEISKGGVIVVHWGGIADYLEDTKILEPYGWKEE